MNCPHCGSEDLVAKTINSDSIERVCADYMRGVISGDVFLTKLTDLGAPEPIRRVIQALDTRCQDADEIRFF